VKCQTDLRWQGGGSHEEGGRMEMEERRGELYRPVINKNRE
jgi:hypothetical protein